MERLKRALRIKFGLSPGQPTDLELADIIFEIELVSKERVPNDSDWAQAVSNHCPSKHHYAYAGQDTSDLNALLAKMKGKG